MARVKAAGGGEGFQRVEIDLGKPAFARPGDQCLQQALGDAAGRAALVGAHEHLAQSGAAFAEIEERFRNRDIWTRRDGVWRLDGFLIDDWNWYPKTATMPMSSTA